MAPKVARTRQEHVEDLILELVSNGVEWTTADIQKAVKKRLPPTPADNEPANERSSEVKYDAIISNALQAKRRLCRDGLIERRTEGHFLITKKGEKAALDNRHDLDEATAVFEKVFPEGLD